MKKTSIVLLLVLALALIGVMVSCKNEISAPADELVSVSFEEADASRSLTATLEAFDKDNYYWKYAADKADDSGLTSGETATYDEAGALPVSNGNKGLRSVSDDKPYKVPGFSQGLWNFKLYAYRNKNAETGAYEDLVYQGEAKNVSLTKGGDNTALVTVSPATEGNGYIKIGTITFVPKKSGDQAAQLKFISVTNPDGSAVEGISYDASTATYTVPTGAYKVTVKFANAAQTVVYGEGYVIATVYPNLTTTIGGDLSELVTYAQFDAEQNPDAVKVQAVSEEVGVGTGTAVAVSGSTGSGENLKTVSTSIARADVNKIIEQMAAEQAIPATPTGDGASTKVKLALNVDPTEATETSVTYEIGMEATLTYKESSSAPAQVSNKAIKNLLNAIIIEISMPTGLSNVSVTHSGAPMDKGTGAGSLTDGQYYYDNLDGKLYICTSTFSPFAINYKVPTNYVAKVGDVKYATLAAAVQKADATHAVELIADVALTDTVIVDKSLTLKLNGFNITAANCRAIHVQEGTLTLTGKGTIAAGTAVSTFGDSSSVIRVGDNEGEAAGLVVGANVTISSSYCYGVSIFGKETEGQTLVVNGKIKVTGTASAISGNGSDYLTANTITINGGAEVYAENDYAIYHPQRGTLTVAGGTIEGKGGIETKGGNVIINGGVITATATSVTHTEYNNGASTSGYALASVENKNYPGEANIYVSGGTVNGEIIVVKDTEAAFDPVIEISGGLYSEKPLKDYIKIGYKAVLNQTTGYYEIVTVVLTLVEAVDSTCEDEGHHTYWLGDDDNKYILDGENLWIATETDLVIAPHHHWVYSERSESPDAEGLYSVEYECQVCGETKVVDGWKLVQIESNESETPVNLWSYLEPLTKTDLSGEKTIFELGEGLYTVKAPGFNSPKEMYLRTECIIVGKGSAKTTIQITNDGNWKKGIQLYNRYQNESGIPQSNFQFAGLTIEDKSQDASKDWHLLLITSYGVELGLNDVVIKGFVGTTNIGLWDNQTLTGGKYPTKADEQGVYISMKGVKIVDSVKPFIQNQSFTAKNIADQSDCYASIHILVDGASGEYLSLATQSGNNIHDGIHTEWFVNGAIARVPGTTGIYAPTEVAELQ